MKVEKKNLSLALACVLVGILVGAYVGYAASPSNTITISGGIYPGAPSYTIYKVGSTYYAKDQNGLNEFSGTSSSTVINNAFNALTSGRTWQETIVLEGTISLDDTIEMPSYSRLIINGRLTMSDGTNEHMIVNDDQTAGNTAIDITGGLLDHGSQTGGIIIYLKRAVHVAIKDCKFDNAAWDSIRIEQCGDVQITGNYFTDSGAYAINAIDHAEYGAVLEFGGIIAHNTFLENFNNILIQGSGSYNVDWIIEGNWIYHGQWGIYLLSNGLGSVVADVYIWNNYIDYPGEYGIYANYANDGCIAHVLIQNNKIEEARKHSIFIRRMGQAWMITNNMISDTGHLADTTYDGIHVESVVTGESGLSDYQSLNVQGNEVRCKHLTSYGTNKRTRYGLNILPTLKNTWIMGNYFEGGLAAYNFTQGSTCIFENNVNGTISGGVVTYAVP